jgi:hypothetical protein
MAVVRHAGGPKSSALGSFRVSLDIQVRVMESGAEAHELEELASALREEILELDVDQVKRLSSGDAPPDGTRALDVASIGALLVTLSSSSELMSRVVSVLRAWADRRGGRSVEITVGSNSIRLIGASKAQQDRLIEQFIRASAS